MLTLGPGALSFDLAARVHGPVALVEVLRAERADVPLRTDELPARRADSLEARAARRAEDEFLLHAFLAGRTDHALLGFGKEALFGELAFVRLAEGLLGANDEIEEEAEDVQDHDHQAREVREDLVLGALLCIADRPEHHRQVDREDVEAGEAHRQLDQRVADDRRPESVEIRHSAQLLRAQCPGGPGHASNQEGLEESARTGFSAPSRSRAGTWRRRPTGWERRRAANVPDPPGCGSSRSSAIAGCSASHRWTRCARGRRCRPLPLPRARARASTRAPCRARRSSRAWR